MRGQFDLRFEDSEATLDPHPARWLGTLGYCQATAAPDRPRREFHHEPASTRCASPGCGALLQRMGEDVTEKLASARQAGDLMSMLCLSDSRQFIHVII